VDHAHAPQQLSCFADESIDPTLLVKWIGVLVFGRHAGAGRHLQNDRRPEYPARLPLGCANAEQGRGESFRCLLKQSFGGREKLVQLAHDTPRDLEPRWLFLIRRRTKGAGGETNPASTGSL
jgi:hypothetical protein